MRRLLVLSFACAAASCFGSDTDDVTEPIDAPDDGMPTLTVSLDGTGSGNVLSSPAGISCGADCTQDFPPGSVVTLTATASSGTRFAGWSGGCTGIGLCTVSLTADITVTATFDSTFQCANDSSIEPNDNVQTPFVTPVAGTLPNYSLVGLAICPSSDLDHYRFDITSAGTNVETTITGTPGRTPLALSVLNASATQIATGSPVAGTPHQIRVELPSPAPGVYFIRVRSPDDSENNYDLSIKTCSTPLPCP